MGVFPGLFRTTALSGLLVAGALSLAAPAGAVEYRLRVASLYESAFVYFLTPTHLKADGSAVPLARLEATLDSAELPAAVLLYRPVEPASARIARSFGVKRVRPIPEADDTELEQWMEVRWDGKPGERSLWVVAATEISYQELYHLGLKGTESLRYVIPYDAPLDEKKLPSVTLPLYFIQSFKDPGGLWERHLAEALDLSKGIAVVVGENQDGIFPDHVFLVVNHAPEPTTYKAVLGWRRRPSVDFGNIESAGDGNQN